MKIILNLLVFLSYISINKLYAQDCNVERCKSFSPNNLTIEERNDKVRLVDGRNLILILGIKKRFDDKNRDFEKQLNSFGLYEVKVKNSIVYLDRNQLLDLGNNLIGKLRTYGINQFCKHENSHKSIWSINGVLPMYPQNNNLHSGYPVSNCIRNMEGYSSWGIVRIPQMWLVQKNHLPRNIKVPKYLYYTLISFRQYIPPIPKTLHLKNHTSKTKWRTGKLCKKYTSSGSRNSGCSGHEYEEGTGTTISFGEKESLTLPFNKNAIDKGAARHVSVTVEDNTSANVLYTRPRETDRGCIKGYFPWMEISNSARFKAKVGFPKPFDFPNQFGFPKSSKQAKKTFRDVIVFWVFIHYYEDRQHKWKGFEIKKSYTKKLAEFDIDLSKFGNKVQIELRVDTDSSAREKETFYTRNSSEVNAGVWVNPRIEN